MTFIYVYTNDYFNYKNTRKIGSTLNPFIRLSNYLTYYQDKGKFEYLFKINYDNPYEIDEKIKSIYLKNNNTKNNGCNGGTEIYENKNIKENLLKCFSEEDIKYEELDPNEPPITKKYTNNIEKEILNSYKNEKKNKDEKIIYNKYKKLIQLVKIPEKEKILEEIYNEFGGDLIKRTTIKYIASKEDYSLYEDIYFSFLHQNIEVPINFLNQFEDLKILVEGPPKFPGPYYFVSINKPIKIPINNVHIFSVPISDYKCSLNEKGRKKYGKLSDLHFEKKSKVGTKYGHIELPEIRKSRYISSTFEFEGHNLEEIIKENINVLAPNDIVTWNKKSKYTVLEYQEGDFFSEHRDNKINRNHCGTLLILPPAINELQHTGGEFIIEDNGYDFIIPSWNNKDWKFIVFPTELKHACHKVLSGKRIVIKTELYKKNSPNNFENIPESICCDGGIDYLKEKHLCID
jgi:hypothetical protein